MPTAIVMIDTEPALIPEVASEIAEVGGVAEVYSVTGEIDLIAIVRVSDHKDFADVIADKISKIHGVRRTQTYLAFREFSTKDLDEAFDIGI
ncbi:Lrp/AsnC family transcriptional regulator [Timonella senegalensis]|uniref:Lrp/AsnC family transcriptional regulator n=1 Tax=Timonella senegalensis TaxID=1465825 RepID=UPI0002D6BAE5|nr:Lrp/AsnC ligand binding domain-containing protein [Timonella senegalensis]